MTRRLRSSALLALAAALALGMSAVARAGGAGGTPTPEPVIDVSGVGPSIGTPVGMSGMTGMTATPDGWVSMPAEHLQVMIDTAPVGSTLEVPQAVYVGSVRVDRPLTLVGQGRPILDGAGQGSVLHITGGDVTVRNFTIRGSGSGPVGAPSGIMIEGGDRALIQDVHVEATYLGITVRRSEGVTIDDVRIRGYANGIVSGEMHAVGDGGPSAGTGDMPGMTGAADESGTGLLRGDGIWLWNTVDAVVRSSDIAEVRDGVYLSYGVRPLLQGNTIADARYAVHDMYATGLRITRNTLRGNLSGCVLMYGGPIVLTANTIVESGSPSTGYGVLVKDAGDVTLTRNVIADNRVGLHIDDAGRTGGVPARLVDNMIAMNQIGAMLYPSSDSTFTGNSFIENSAQVTLGGAGTTQVRWTEGGVGNFWSDYGGFDAQRDGRGDIPYVESGHMSRLLAEEPILQALESGPAFRLLSAVEDKWSASDPVVLDEAPLMRSRAPSIRGADRGVAVPLWIPGLAAMLVCGRSLVRGRRPRGGVAVGA